MKLQNNINIIIVYLLDDAIKDREYLTKNYGIPVLAYIPDYDLTKSVENKETEEAAEVEEIKDVKILNSKLYPKGTEAKISIKSEIIDVATFIPGETAVSYMACAVAIASALNIKHDDIIDGIAEYTS